MIISSSNLLGKVIRDNETYVLEDNSHLSNLVVSKTVLHRGKCTTGHSHDNKDEVYIFNSGHGSIQIGDETFVVSPGSIALIPGGKFHKVFNHGNEDMVFVSIFEKYDR